MTQPLKTSILKTSVLKTSLWDNNSHLTPLYDKLFKELAPTNGAAKTKHGELLRCFSNVYYDCYNNGGCNLSIKEDELKTISLWRDKIAEHIRKQRSDPKAFSRIMDALMAHAHSVNSYLEDWPKEDLEIMGEAIISLVDILNKRVLEGVIK